MFLQLWRSTVAIDRITRLNELLHREISEAIYRFVTEDNFDLAAVTVSRVIMSRSLQHARVMISIRGHENERASMLHVLEKHRPEIQSKINTDLHIKYTPKLIFQLDPSIEKGDRILSILAEMEDNEEPQDTGDPVPGQNDEDNAGEKPESNG